MKKRLLITSALMTAVLGASLATGTYAWYNATFSTQSKALANTTSETISASDPNYVISTDLPIVVTLTREYAGAYTADTTTNTGLELGTWMTDTSKVKTAGFYHAYHTNNKLGELVYQTNQLNSTTLSEYAVYKAVITVADSWEQKDEDENVLATWTKEQLATALNGSKVSVSLAQKDEETSDSRAMFYGLGTTKVDAKPTAAGTNALTTTTDITLADLAGSGTTFYFSLYIDGENATAIDSGAVSGNFTVTVTGTSVKSAA